MPLYSVDITKRFEGFEWHNNYTLNAPDMDAAVAGGEGLVEFEREIHFLLVEFIELKVSPIPNPDRDLHRTIVLTVNGLRNVIRENYGEAKRVLYVILPTALGMPGRKMYRYCVADGDYQGKGEGALITNNSFILSWEQATTTLQGALAAAPASIVIGNRRANAIQLEIGTVSSLQTRKRHYNRSTAGTPDDPPPVNP